MKTGSSLLIALALFSLNKNVSAAEPQCTDAAYLAANAFNAAMLAGQSRSVPEKVEVIKMSNIYVKNYGLKFGKNKYGETTETYTFVQENTHIRDFVVVSFIVSADATCTLQSAVGVDD